MEEWLDRYYNLRRRTGYDRPNFFVTNRGEKIVKIYDDVTKIFGQKLTASIFRKMVETSGRDHDAVTSGAIAQALQHSDRTANQYYRLPDATEALRRNKQIETVDHTALVKSYVDKNFEDLFPLEPYIKFDAEEWRAKIRDCQAFEEYPSATIDLFYVEKLGDKFYGAMYVRRSEILAEEMAIEKYTKLNYTDHAVIDMDARTKLRWRLASAYGPPEIRSVYHGFPVDPAPPPRGVTRWLSPVTDPLFTRSRSEPRSTPRRRHQVVKPSDRPALHEVAVRTSNALVPKGFGASAPRAPARLAKTF
ncbi:uncharacterized protein LOC132933039 [Metopolophium dirhodum]|uniref:uncharacterized protein LOC132933039 n=1 Tax=Metopolophium dirhodum TaxID=44670 RepID=UPI00298FBCF5|nr:uncharacterized protein LOC132933039 [Metopolophium dirhodum]